MDSKISIQVNQGKKFPHNQQSDFMDLRNIRNQQTHHD